MAKKHEGPGLAKVDEARNQQGLAKKRVFRFYDGEYAAWQEKAKAAGVSLTTWLRHAAERYAKR